MENSSLSRTVCCLVVNMLLSKPCRLANAAASEILWKLIGWRTTQPWIFLEINWLANAAALEIPSKSPATVLVVRKQGDTSLLLPEAVALKAFQAETDPVNDLLIERWTFNSPLDDAQLDNISFLPVTPNQSPWLDNMSSPVSVPIDREDALTPRAGPILVR